MENVPSYLADRIETILDQGDLELRKSPSKQTGEHIPGACHSDVDVPYPQAASDRYHHDVLLSAT